MPRRIGSITIDLRTLARADLNRVRNRHHSPDPNMPHLRAAASGTPSILIVHRPRPNSSPQSAPVRVVHANQNEAEGGSVRMPTNFLETAFKAGDGSSDAASGVSVQHGANLLPDSHQVPFDDPEPVH